MPKSLPRMGAIAANRVAAVANLASFFLSGGLVTWRDWVQKVVTSCSNCNEHLVAKYLHSTMHGSSCVTFADKEHRYY